MRYVQTAYPCESCKKEISPLFAYCPHCGTKQPDHNQSLVYNLFYRAYGHEKFNVMFNGEPILQQGDILDQKDDIVSGSDRYEYYVAGFYLADETLVGMYESRVAVKSWSKLSAIGLGEDEGPRVATVNYLE